MPCLYKIFSLDKCYSCGKIKRIYKCKKLNLIIGRNTCRFCKFYSEGSKD